MEIIKSKINEFRNYSKNNISQKNRKISKKLIEYNLNNGADYININRNNHKKFKSFYILSKDTETQTSFRYKGRGGETLTNINRQIKFQNKTLNNWISSSTSRNSMKTKKLQLDKLFCPYLPNNYIIYQNTNINKNINSNNNKNYIHCIKSNFNKNIKEKEKEKEKEKFSLTQRNERNNALKENNKLVRQSNSVAIKKVRLNNDLYKNYYKSSNYINEYKHKNKDANKVCNYPILIKDLEILKLIYKMKNKRKNNFDMNETPMKENRKNDKTSLYNKIFLSSDILRNSKSSVKDLIYTKLMNTKIVLNKNIIKNNYIFNIINNKKQNNFIENSNY